VAALALLLSAAMQAAMLAAPLLTMHVFDGVLMSRNGDTLAALAIGFALVTLLGVVLRYLRAALVAAATERSGRRLQLLALRAAVRAALGGDRARGLSALGDSGEVRRLLGGGVASDLLDLLSMPAALLMLFLLHPAYGWTVLAGCLALLLLGALADRTTRGMVREAGAGQARNHAALTGRLASRDMVEGLGMLPAILARWQPEHARALEGTDAAQRRARAIQGIAALTGLVLQMTVAVVGLWLVGRQAASPGSLLAATMLAGMAAGPVGRIVATWRDWAFGVAAWRRLSALVAGTALPAPLPRCPAAPHGLEARDLSVATPDRTRVLVRELHLAVAPGEVVGLRGANGAGKSSLMRTLLGIAPPAGGTVRLDGEDTHAPAEADGRAGLGAKLGYLPQGGQLLHGSVLDNIRRFGAEDEARAVAAARLVGAHATIGRLRAGYDSPAGPDAGLSGGQRQLVALARAFHGGPRLLVLDEPEAGLDAAAVEGVRDAVARAARGGAAVVLATHDPGGWAGVVTHWLDLGPGGTWTIEEAGRAA
jgi:ATP-binding cassette subfamily C protein